MTDRAAENRRKRELLASAALDRALELQARIGAEETVVFTWDRTPGRVALVEDTIKGVTAADARDLSAAVQRLAATSISVEKIDGMEQDLSSVDAWLDSIMITEDSDDGQHPAGAESTGRSRFETH